MPSGSMLPVGRLGEEAATRFLMRRGLRVVARNLRSRLGEIDLVGEEGSSLVFIEVKTRSGVSGDPPQAAVDARKRARLARLALEYLRRRRLSGRRCRFDVVAVTLDDAGSPLRVEHFPGAFVTDGWSG